MKKLIILGKAPIKATIKQLKTDDVELWMCGTDRASGEKWNMQECKDVALKNDIDLNVISPAEWYLVMNMMYSDYYQVGRKHGLTDYPFYAELAIAWFDDVDADENKTFKYFFN